MVKNGQTHEYWLDFLKFISMIIVFLCHLRMAFFYDKYGEIYLGRFVLPNYIFNGNLAVCMFLLVSVYLYAKKALEDKSGNSVDFWKLSIKRYIRLIVPAVVCNLLIFNLFLCNCFFNIGAYDVDVPYVNDWFCFTSPIKALLSMFWADVNTCLFAIGYNPPLWCYNLLFTFPLLVFVVIRLLGPKKSIMISFVILPLLLLHKSYFAVIPLCLISVSDFKQVKYFKMIWCGVMIFCIGLQILDATYKICLINDYNISLNMLLATSIFNIIKSFSSKERNICNLSIFYQLNKIGFSIYLLHMPIICSVGFYMFRAKQSMLLIFSVIIILLLVVSVFFHKFVEKKLSLKIISMLNL